MGGGEDKGPEDSRTPKGTRVTTRATPPIEIARAPSLSAASHVVQLVNRVHDRNLYWGGMTAAPARSRTGSESLEGRRPGKGAETSR
jgi:hypothetical protein